MRRPHLALVLLALLLPVPWSPGPAEAQPAPVTLPSAVPWWGPADFGSGWNLRVPVRIDTTLPGPVSNLPVRVEVDLGRATEASGWPTTTVAGRSVLQSFTLLPSSVRAVEYTNFRLPRLASTDAQPVVADADLPEPDRFLLAAEVTRGYTDLPQTAPFDPSVNPTVSVRFVLPGETSPDRPRYVLLYFDVAENGPQAGADPSIARGSLLDGLDWIGRGTRVFGTGSLVAVTALLDGTDVTVYRYAGRDRAPAEKGFRLAAGQSRVVQIAQTAEPWYVAASGPIVANSNPDGFIGPTGFAPSWDGTLLGTEWDVPWQSVLEFHVYNPGDRPARLTFDGDPRDTEIVLPGARTIERPGDTSGRLEISSTAPILVQAQTYEAEQYPFVAPSGAPTGQRLFGTLDAQLRRDDAFGSRVAGYLRAASLTERETQVRATLLSTGEQVVPRPRGGAATGTAPVPGAPAWVAHQTADSGKGPVELQVLGPPDEEGRHALAAVGGPREHIILRGRPATIAAPLGGQDARNFSSPTAVNVFAYHNATQVTVTREGGAPERFVLERFQQEAVEASATDPVVIRASRAVAVVPTTGIAFGAGLLDAARATTGVVQYRGPLISLVPADDEDEPMVRSVSFGGTTAYRLEVQNLGRNTDGSPLPDTVRLSLPPVPPGWNATIEPRTLGLGPDGRGEVTLTVTSPETRGTGDRLILPVRAASAANANMTDEVTTVTLLRERRGVGLWFDRVDGPTQLTLRFRPGEERTVPLVVKNTGSSEDTLRLSLGLVEAGWSARFLENDTVVRSVSLRSGQTRPLSLEVTAPPPGGLLLPASLALQATSTNDTTVTAKVVLDGLVATETNVRLESETQTLSARPGEEVRFRLGLLNRGESAVDVRLNVTGELPEGWARPDFQFRGRSLAGVEDRLSSVAPTDAAGVPLELVIEVPVDAPGGLATAILAWAIPSGFGGGDPDLLALNLHVEPFVALEARGLDTIQIGPGARAEVPIRLANEGNVRAELASSLLGSPRGYSIALPERLEVPPRGNATLELTIDVPAGAPPGEHRVRIGLADRTGAFTELELPVRIPALALLEHVGPTRLVVPPGVTTNLTLALRNDGNVPANETLVVDAPTGWEAALADVPPVAPLATAQVQLAVRPGRDATGTGALNVTFDRPGVSAPVAALLLDVRRPALRLEEAIPVREGSRTTGVRGVLVNDANVTVENVVVALVSGDRVLARTVIERVPPFVPRLVVMSTGDAQLPEGAELVVDPAGRFVEEDTSDNALPVRGAAGERGAPGPGGALLLGPLLLVAAWRRRPCRL